jgi:hypothetical protein
MRFIVIFITALITIGGTQVFAEEESKQTASKAKEGGGDLRSAVQNPSAP